MISATAAYSANENQVKTTNTATWNWNICLNANLGSLISPLDKTGRCQINTGVKFASVHAGDWIFDSFVPFLSRNFNQFSDKVEQNHNNKWTKCVKIVFVILFCFRLVLDSTLPHSIALNFSWPSVFHGKSTGKFTSIFFEH